MGKSAKEFIKSIFGGKSGQIQQTGKDKNGRTHVENYSYSDVDKKDHKHFTRTYDSQGNIDVSASGWQRGGKDGGRGKSLSEQINDDNIAKGKARREAERNKKR